MCNFPLPSHSITNHSENQLLTAVQLGGFQNLADFAAAASAAQTFRNVFDMSPFAGHKPGYYKKQKGYQLDFVKVIEELKRRHITLPYSSGQYERNKTCSDQFVWAVGAHSERATLAVAFRCSLPLCPCCEASRSHKRLLELSEALEVLQASRAALGKSPLVALMLTETLPNCRGEELSDYIDLLFRAHDKLMHYKAVSSVVLGAARSFEITHKREDDYHPHLHTLLLVEQSYFTKKGEHSGYLSQDAWAKLHYKAVKACCKNSPIAWSDIQQPEGQTFSLNIKRAYKKGADVHASLLDSMTDAGKEATKYVCKPDELMRYRPSADGKILELDMNWSCEAVSVVSSAIHGRRRYTSSGLWRQALSALGYSPDSSVDDDIGSVTMLSREDREPDSSGLSFAVLAQAYSVDVQDYLLHHVATTTNPDDYGVFAGTKLMSMVERNIAKRIKAQQRKAAASAALLKDWTLAGPADGWSVADTKEYFPDG